MILLYNWGEYTYSKTRRKWAGFTGPFTHVGNGGYEHLPAGFQMEKLQKEKIKIALGTGRDGIFFPFFLL